MAGRSVGRSVGRLLTRKDPGSLTRVDFTLLMTVTRQTTTPLIYSEYGVLLLL